MIVITAGHTGNSSGAQGVEIKPGVRFDEGSENIWLRNRIVDILNSCYGITALTDNDSERLALLTSRLNAVVNEGDFCLDIHFNASSRRTANGTEIIIADDATQQEAILAIKLLNASASALGTDQRSIKRERQTPHRRLAMLHLRCPSAILEVCFCTNADDVAAYFANRELLAKAIARVLAENMLDQTPLCTAHKIACSLQQRCLIAMLHRRRRSHRRTASATIFLIAIALTFTACSPRKSTYHSSSFVHDSVFVEHLVPYALPPDSATIEALLKCDSLGRVYASNLNLYATRNANLSFKIDSLGRLKSNTIIAHDTIFIPSTTEKITTLQHDTTIIETVTTKTPAAAKHAIIIETLIIVAAVISLIIYVIVKLRIRRT